MKRAATRPFVAVGLVALLAFALAGCGSVTAKHTDGGGGGGAHADSSTRTDVAADRPAEEDARLDAPVKHDASPARDMSLADVRTSDARATDAASGGGGGMSGGTGGGTGTGGAGGTGGECQSNGDCMLYTGAGKSCCGICQPKSEPAPPPMQCLIACVTPLVTCGCSNQQCVGSSKGL